MRVRVRFRYRPETGEVELYEVEDVSEGPRTADHDARHDRAAATLARLVEDSALIEEVYGAGTSEGEAERQQAAPDERSAPRTEETDDSRTSRRERRERD